MFDGAGFCGRCGTERSRTVDDDAAPLTCPGCEEAMTRLTVGTAEMFECQGCDGLWVDAATFEELCTTSEQQTAVLHQFSTPGQAKAPAVQYRKCARCPQLMNRVNFGRLSGVIVDACRGHGTYLDAGELHRIVRFIQSGGLNRARARQIEDLNEQQRQVLDAERRAARARGRSEAEGKIGWSFLIGE